MTVLFLSMLCIMRRRDESIIFVGG